MRINPKLVSGDDKAWAESYIKEKTLSADRYGEWRMRIMTNTPQPAYDTVTGNVGEHCSRCNWRKICPFYQATKNYEKSNSSLCFFMSFLSPILKILFIICGIPMLAAYNRKT